MTGRTPFAVIASLGILSACAVGPDYKRPEVAVPSSYRGEAAVEEAKSIADLGWWELYRDQNLTELIRTAVAQNLDLQLAVARVDEARARAHVADAEFFPTIGGTLSTSARAAGVGSTYTGGAQLSWEIDFFGRVRRSSQAARADILASEEGRRAAVASLVAQVASTYCQLRILDDQKAITEDTIKSEEASLALVHAQMRGGIASGTEEQQALGQLASVRAQLPVIKRQIAQAENQLSVLLGKSPGPILRSSGEEEGLVPPEVPSGLPSELLERRPDILQAEQQLVAATARIGVAKAQAFPFPRFFLTAFAGALSGSLSELLKGNGASLNSLGPGVTWPLFDLAGRGNLKVAEAQARQAAITYRSTILKALQEVADSLATVQTVRSQIDNERVRATAGKEYVRLTKLRYAGGVSSYLEVLDSERQLYSAQMDYASARLTQLQAAVQLYRALGGGWSDAPPSAPPLPPGPAPEPTQEGGSQRN